MKTKYTILLFCILLLSGCNTEVQPETKPLEPIAPTTQTTVLPDNSSPAPEELPILYEVDSIMNREYHYDYLTDLQKESTDIFRGKVISATAQVTGPLPYTKYEVEVLEAFSGNLSPGETIKVAVLGATVKADEYFDKADMHKSYATEYSPEVLESSYIKVTCDGAWFMEVGKEYLLFTQYISYDDDMVYSPLNTWQGIFQEQYGLYERYESTDYKEYKTLVSPGIPSLRFSLEELRNPE